MCHYKSEVGRFKPPSAKSLAKARTQPKPYTLNPQPSTPNPQPSTLKAGYCTRQDVDGERLVPTCYRSRVTCQLERSPLPPISQSLAHPSLNPHAPISLQVPHGASNFDGVRYTCHHFTPSSSRSLRRFIGGSGPPRSVCGRFRSLPVLHGSPLVTIDPPVCLDHRCTLYRRILRSGLR
jgi:hypothetical protein